MHLVLSMVRGHGNKEANSLIRTSGTLVYRLQPPQHLLPICMVPTSQLLVGIPLHIRWWHGSLFLSISIVHFWNTLPHVVHLFFCPCFPISICLKCISVQQRLACFLFFLFCSDWWKWVRDNRGSWSAHEEYTVASCWRYFCIIVWCFVSPNYDAIAQQLHDLQNFLEFLSGSFVFRIHSSSLISFHHGQDKMMLLMQQVLHFCIWGNAIYKEDMFFQLLTRVSFHFLQEDLRTSHWWRGWERESAQQPW